MSRGWGCGLALEGVPTLPLVIVSEQPAGADAPLPQGLPVPVLPPASCMALAWVVPGEAGAEGEAAPWEGFVRVGDVGPDEAVALRDSRTLMGMVGRCGVQGNGCRGSSG